MTTLTETPTSPTPPTTPQVTAPPEMARSGPRLRRMHYEPEPGGPEPGDAAGLPPPPPRPVTHATARVDRDAVQTALAGVVRLAMEVLDGRRPPAQLTHHFDAPALRYLLAAARQRQVRAPARVKRMVLCLPRAGAAELAAVCDIDGRIRALAARFERADPTAAWRCTALRLG